MSAKNLSNDTKRRELATEIVRQIRDNSAPGSCTWGDQNPEAHFDLFYGYDKDMIADIVSILRNKEEEQ